MLDQAMELAEFFVIRPVSASVVPRPNGHATFTSLLRKNNTYIVPFIRDQMFGFAPVNQAACLGAIRPSNFPHTILTGIPYALAARYIFGIEIPNVRLMSLFIVELAA